MRELIKKIFDLDRNPIIFIFVGIFVFGILISSVFNILKDSLGLSDKEIFLYSSIIVALVMYLYSLLERDCNIESIASIGTSTPQHHKGLIVFCSQGRGSSSAKRAIKYHLPALEQCWFFYSDSSKDDAEKIMANIRDKNGAIKFNEKIIDDEHIEDPVTFYNEVEKIYNNLPKGLMNQI